MSSFGCVGRDDRVVCHTCRVGEAGANVLDNEIGEVGDDLRLANTAGEHFQHVRHPHPRSGHGRAVAPDGGIHGDPWVPG